MASSKQPDDHLRGDRITDLPFPRRVRDARRSPAARAAASPSDG